MRKNIVIIGGGAAGFFAAITCAEANPAKNVMILERGKDVLGKVKISGGGRCNVTHACFEPRALTAFYPRGAKALLGPFHQFCSGDTVDWFEKRGVETKIEEDGRMFPITDNSQTIMDCLTESAENAGVQLLLKTRLTDLEPPSTIGEDWTIHLADNKTITAEKIMVATGSNPRVWNILKKIGHQIVEPVPSLFTFNIKDPRIEGLAGLSVKNAQVKIPGTKLEDAGPLLITHWGMSGPGILKLSAWGARILFEKKYQFSIIVNWLGFVNFEEALEDLKKIKNEIGGKTVLANAQFHLPQRLWKSIVNFLKIKPETRWGDLNKKTLHQLATQLTAAVFEVNGKSTFKEEFVTAGGVNLKEVNFKRFESRVHPNLFFAGEVLDIDAVTGGFNFQAAWTGGFIAGNSLAN